MLMTGSGKVGGNSVIFEFLATESIARDILRRPTSAADVRRNTPLQHLCARCPNNQSGGHAFSSASARIVNWYALLERSGIDAEEHQLASIDISPKFETRANRIYYCRRVRRQRCCPFPALASHRPECPATGQIIDNGIQQAAEHPSF